MTISTKSWVIAVAIAVAATASVGVAMTGDPEPEPEHEPQLCEIDDGAWCEACGDKGEPACPAGMSGWLCCSESSGQRVCVASGLAECGGAGQTLGWCANYIEDPVTGAATCYD